MDPGASTVATIVMTPFVRFVYAAGPRIVERCAERVSALLGRWGLTVADLEEDPSLRLPFRLMCDFSQLCIDLLDDPAAPLRAAAHLRRNDFELLHFLVSSCPTFGAAIDCQARYCRLLVDAEYDLRVFDEWAELHFRFAPELNAPAHVYEFAMASNAIDVMQYAGGHGGELFEARFGHPAPAYSDLFPKILGAPARFECSDYALVFPARILGERMRGSNSALHAVLRRQADRELASLPTRSALPNVVRGVLERDLAGAASLQGVASTLGISGSSLRSKLRDHGTTFSAILDTLRRDHAQRLLSRRDTSIAEVSDALGFSHPPALSRATRRWFGMSPTAYRAAVVRKWGRIGGWQVGQVAHAGAGEAT